MFQTSFNPNNSLLIILQISLLFRFTPALTYDFARNSEELLGAYHKEWPESRYLFKVQVLNGVSNAWSGHKLNRVHIKIADFDHK